MGEDQFRPILKGTAVTGFRFRQITGVMIQQSQIDMRIGKCWL